MLFTSYRKKKSSSNLDDLRNSLNTNCLFQIYSIILICVSGFKSMNRSITEYIVKGRGDSAVSDTLYTPPDRVDHSARVDASESKGSKRLRVN